MARRSKGVLEMAIASPVMKATALRRDIVRKVRQVGVLQTLQHGVRKLVRGLSADFTRRGLPADPFDCKYGTDTTQIISVGALDIPEEKLAHSNRYEAVVREAFDAIVRDLAIDHGRFVFIDIGSGKGRALLLASCFPFQEIIGVEISATLTRIAEDNIRIFKDDEQRCHSIRTVCCDGGSFELPLVDAVLYLNNPFDDKVMQPLLSRIERSLAAYPRKLLVVYQRPLHRVLWDRSPAFRLIAERDRYVAYESV
jgi:hypothetical protein